MIDYRNEEDARIYCTMKSPAKIHSMDLLAEYDEYAQRSITDCKHMIETLEAYRLQLHERAQTLTTAPYHYELELKREKHWNDAPVRYFLTLYRVFDVPGIERQAETETRYKGTERSKALKDFEAMKKSRPGIIATLDIERRSWER
jgi:hypothetical protein